MKAAIAVTLLAASLQADVASLAGDSGVVLALDATGNSLAEAHRDRTFTPASTLKVVTTWLAAETMGLDVRFETDFYLDGDWLIVRGKGDPGLVSEEVDLAAKALVPLLPGKVLAGVAVDDSFFVDGIEIPGVTRSSEPYDALNSATAVNFNTINVTVDGSTVTSAEAQTPLIPLAVEVAKARGVRGTNRINIGDDVHKARRYAAELFAALLAKNGATVGPGIGERKAPASAPFYTHRSSKTLADVCSGMLYYSNNYTANQVFLAMGARVSGEPASLEKSQAVARERLAQHPELSGLVMVEGSGISYENKATADAMAGALALFEPHRALLRVKDGTQHKTGTLKITKSVVGYLDTKQHGLVRFVVVMDGGGSQRRWDIVNTMKMTL